MIRQLKIVEPPPPPLLHFADSINRPISQQVHGFLILPYKESIRQNYRNYRGVDKR